MLTTTEIDYAHYIMHTTGGVWLTAELVLLPVVMWTLWHVRGELTGQVRCIIESAMLAVAGRLLFSVLIAIWELHDSPLAWLDAIVLARGLRIIPLPVFLLAVVLPLRWWRVMRALCAGAVMVLSATVVLAIIEL